MLPVVILAFGENVATDVGIAMKVTMPDTGKIAHEGNRYNSFITRQLLCNCRRATRLSLFRISVVGHVRSIG